MKKIMLLKGVSRLKKHLSLILGVTMLLSTCTASFAAIHEYGKADTTTNTWYTIETTDPYLMGSVKNIDPTINGNFELYRDEQTYLDLSYLNQKFGDLNQNLIIFNGSYLFENGFFFGGNVNYNRISTKILDESIITNSTNWSFWPGYRFNFDQGYAAASIDIGKTPANKVEVIRADFDGQYLLDNAKIEGELVIPNGGDTTISLQGRLKLIEELVVGLDLYMNGDNSDLTIGATYIPIPELIFDAQLGSNNYTALSGMYYLENFGFGIEYRKGRLLSINTLGYMNIISIPDEILPLLEQETPSQIYLKGNFNIGDTSKLVLTYGLKNDNVPSIIILGYEQSL